MTDETPDAETLAFELSAVTSVAGTVARTLDELVRRILAAIEAARITQTPVDIAPQIITLIRRFEFVSMVPALEEVATEAKELGILRAVRRFINPMDKLRATVTTDFEPETELPDIDRMVSEGLREAAVIATRGVRNRRQASAVAGRLRATRARVEGTARYVANEGINAGTAAVASAMDLRLLWVAERNACLHCLAHAGYTVEPGALFPAGLSFDPRGSRFNAVPHPPLHPNCRCQVRTYEGTAGAPTEDRSSVDPADRLAAEARRSVVYQWTDHASGPAAQRAAEALLRAGAALPSSVEKRARAAVKKGGVPLPTKRRRKA